MAHVFHSGAFLQQCFSVHPLSLSVKLFTPPDTIGIACLQCRFKHRLTVGAVTRLVGDAALAGEDAATALSTCVAAHKEALHVTDISVERKIAQFRCRECKTGVHATVVLFETRQP